VSVPCQPTAPSSYPGPNVLRSPSGFLVEKELLAAGDPSRMSRRSLVIGAALNFLVTTAYSSVTIAVMKLLHCVHVPGTPPAQRRLYIQGSTLCGPALGYKVVVALLGVALVALPLATRWAMQPALVLRRVGDPTGSGAGLGAWRGDLGADLRAGLRRALTEMYRPGAYVPMLLWTRAAFLCSCLGSRGLACRLRYCLGCCALAVPMPTARWCEWDVVPSDCASPLGSS
jgi:hypothetical protein